MGFECLRCIGASIRFLELFLKV
jgi:hypothetical protein